MADRDLNIIIKTINRTREGISAAISAIGRLGVATKVVGQALKRVAFTIARLFERLAIGAIALTGVGGFFVKAASDAREMQSKFAAVFKELTADVAAWAQTTADATKRSVFDLKAWLATLQDTFVPLGFARDKAAEFAKELVKLTIDIASFNNKAEPDVLRDLQSALVGSTETVRKYGIILTDASVRQEAVNLGIAKTTKTVTEAAKVQARLSLIQKGSTDAQGDAIRTAGQFANRVRGLGSRLKDLRVEIGNQLIDGLKLGDVIAGLTRKAGQFFARLRESKAVEKWAERGRAAVEALADIISALFKGGAQRSIVISGFKEIGKDLGQKALDIMKAGAIEIGALIWAGFKGAIGGGIRGAGAFVGRRVEAARAQFGRAAPTPGEETISGLLRNLGGFLGIGGQAGKISGIVAERQAAGLRAAGRGIEAGFIGAETTIILKKILTAINEDKKATEDLKNL